MAGIVRTATVTCPHGGSVRAAAMPADACQFFYDCPDCGRLLRPKPGDCCVFCSYADQPCPPRQAARDETTANGCC